MSQQQPPPKRRKVANVLHDRSLYALLGSSVQESKKANEKELEKEQKAEIETETETETEKGKEKKKEDVSEASKTKPDSVAIKGPNPQPFITSNSEILDELISRSAYKGMAVQDPESYEAKKLYLGGFASGKIYEVYGTISSARQTLMVNLIANVINNQNSRCLYINSEDDLPYGQFMKIPGFNPSSFKNLDMLRIKGDSSGHLRRLLKNIYHAYHRGPKAKNSHLSGKYRLIIIHDFPTLIAREMEHIDQETGKNRKIIRRINDVIFERRKYGHGYRLNSYEEQLKYGGKRVQNRERGLNINQALLAERDEGIFRIVRILKRYVQLNKQCTVLLTGAVESRRVTRVRTRKMRRRPVKADLRRRKQRRERRNSASQQTANGGAQSGLSGVISVTPTQTGGQSQPQSKPQSTAQSMAPSNAQNRAQPATQNQLQNADRNRREDTTQTRNQARSQTCNQTGSQSKNQIQQQSQLQNRRQALSANHTRIATQNRPQRQTRVQRQNQAQSVLQRRVQTQKESAKENNQTQRDERRQEQPGQLGQKTQQRQRKVVKQPNGRAFNFPSNLMNGQQKVQNDGKNKKKIDLKIGQSDDLEGAEFESDSFDDSLDELLDQKEAEKSKEKIPVNQKEAVADQASDDDGDGTDEDVEQKQVEEPCILAEEEYDLASNVADEVDLDVEMNYQEQPDLEVNREAFYNDNDNQYHNGSWYGATMATTATTATTAITTTTMAAMSNNDTTMKKHYHTIENPIYTGIGHIYNKDYNVNMIIDPFADSIKKLKAAMQNSKKKVRFRDPKARDYSAFALYGERTEQERRGQPRLLEKETNKRFTPKRALKSALKKEIVKDQASDEMNCNQPGASKDLRSDSGSMDLQNLKTQENELAVELSQQPLSQSSNIGSQGAISFEILGPENSNNNMANKRAWNDDNIADNEVNNAAIARAEEKATRLNKRIMDMLKKRRKLERKERKRKLALEEMKKHVFQKELFADPQSKRYTRKELICPIGNNPIWADMIESRIFLIQNWFARPSLKGFKTAYCGINKEHYIRKQMKLVRAHHHSAHCAIMESKEPIKEPAGLNWRSKKSIDINFYKTADEIEKKIIKRAAYFTTHEGKVLDLPDSVSKLIAVHKQAPYLTSDDRDSVGCSSKPKPVEIEENISTEKEAVETVEAIEAATAREKSEHALQEYKKELIARLDNISILPPDPWALTNMTFKTETEGANKSKESLREGKAKIGPNESNKTKETLNATANTETHNTEEQDESKSQNSFKLSTEDFNDFTDEGDEEELKAQQKVQEEPLGLPLAKSTQMNDVFFEEIKYGPKKVKTAQEREDEEFTELCTESGSESEDSESNGDSEADSATQQIFMTQVALMSSSESDADSGDENSQEGQSLHTEMVPESQPNSDSELELDSPEYDTFVENLHRRFPKREQRPHIKRILKKVKKIKG